MTAAPERVVSVIVVGVGAIGRQVAMHLASLGVGRLLLIDHRRVSARWAARQGYFAEDMGRLRAQATAELCHRLNPSLDLVTCARLGFQKLGRDQAVFACGLTPRRELAVWRRVRARVAFYGSVRVTGRSVRILTVRDPTSRALCDRVLAREATRHAQTRPSSAGLHVAALAAGLLVAEFTRWTKDVPSRCMRVNCRALKLIATMPG